MKARNILLPIDGSATAEAAARFAEDIARAEGSTVLVLSVVVPLAFRDKENEPLTAAEHDYMAEQVTAVVARIRSAGVAAEGLVVAAPSPHAGILEAAESTGSSMIVMGTHGRSALARAVIGSVADRVVRHSEVPVLLVPLAVESGPRAESTVDDTGTAISE